jgi:hypothetical protein
MRSWGWHSRYVSHVIRSILRFFGIAPDGNGNTFRKEYLPSSLRAISSRSFVSINPAENKLVLKVHFMCTTFKDYHTTRMWHTIYLRNVIPRNKSYTNSIVNSCSFTNLITRSNYLASRIGQVVFTNWRRVLHSRNCSSESDSIAQFTEVNNILVRSKSEKTCYLYDMSCSIVITIYWYRSDF